MEKPDLHELLQKKKMENILQWNCNGFYSHLPELQILIARYKPNYICIQETRLKSGNTITLKNYTAFTKNRNTDQIASGGVAILVKETNYAEPIPLNTSLEAVAIKTYIPEETTICSIYLPPNQRLTETELQHLIHQLPKPYIICGDFNAHNILWGSENTCGRGKLIEKIFDDSIILNNG